jgi:hypothetical protein
MSVGPPPFLALPPAGGGNRPRREGKWHRNNHDGVPFPRWGEGEGVGVQWSRRRRCRT